MWFFFQIFIHADSNGPEAIPSTQFYGGPGERTPPLGTKSPRGLSLSYVLAVNDYCTI